MGLHLKFFLADDGTVVCDAVVPDTYEGPPGYAHGGIIATLLDEAMSKAVRAHGVVAMTAKLEVEYKRPIPSSAPGEAKAVRLEGRLAKSEGRKHWVEARILDAGGVEVAAGKGLFIAIRPRASAVKEASGAR